MPDMDILKLGDMHLHPRHYKAPKGVILKNATVITGRYNEPPMDDRAVYIIYRNGTGIIEKVCPSSDLKEKIGYEIIDLDGRFIMPGLINAHAHIMTFTTQPSEDDILSTECNIEVWNDMVKNLLLELRSGVTTVRSLGEFSCAGVRLRDEIAAGRCPGPRLLVSGPGICPTNGHGERFSVIADGPWEFRKAVRKVLKSGVDWIKLKTTGGVTDSRKADESLTPKMAPEEIEAACLEAHRAGVCVASHTLGRMGIKEAVEAGVDTIEHGGAIDPDVVERFRNNPQTLRGFSSLVVTLSVAHNIAKGKAEAEYMTAVQKENSSAVFREEVDGLRFALENDILVGCGNDVLMPFNTHDTFWREVIHVARYGKIDNLKAIAIATSVNARIIGLDKITGSVVPGLEADLIVLDRDPVEDLRSLRDPKMVFSRGRVILPDNSYDFSDNGMSGE